MRDEDNSIHSIRAQVFRELEKNPLLTAKPLCKILNLPFPRYRKYVTKTKFEWRNTHIEERGSNLSEVHAWRGFTYVTAILPRLVEGWLQSSSRNRFLLFKNGLGRLMWFGTGRVNLYVRKPASLGKACQLFCDGFFKTGLITDVKVLEACLHGVRFKSAHFVFATNQRLPKLTIGLFDESNGVTIKVGDRSHPNSIEAIVSYMDWAERLEFKMDRFLGSEENGKVRSDIGLGRV